MKGLERIWDTSAGKHTGPNTISPHSMGQKQHKKIHKSKVGLKIDEETTLSREKTK